MKTVKGLHDKMYTFDNANTSFHQAAKCKRYSEEVLAFSMSKEDNLLRACDEVENLTYHQGEYTVFKVWEPKERLIMALPFYDRVVQHMIVNAIGPIFEQGFIIILTLAGTGKGCTPQVTSYTNGCMNLWSVRDCGFMPIKGTYTNTLHLFHMTN